MIMDVVNGNLKRQQTGETACWPDFSEPSEVSEMVSRIKERLLQYKQEFAESKSSGSGSSQQNVPQQSPDVGPDGFMNIPDGIEEELQFS